MRIYALGIDLGKAVFHLVGLDSSGQVVVRKRCSRTQLLAFAVNLQVQVIGMEACSGAHFLGRALREQGRQVRLMPAQYVKPYVQTNKSDFSWRTERDLVNQLIYTERARLGLKGSSRWEPRV